MQQQNSEFERRVENFRRLAPLFLSRGFGIGVGKLFIGGAYGGSVCRRLRFERDRDAEPGDIFDGCFRNRLRRDFAFNFFDEDRTQRA